MGKRSNFERHPRGLSPTAVTAAQRQRRHAVTADKFEFRKFRTTDANAWYFHAATLVSPKSHNPELEKNNG
jgi:hypothetical protein